MKIICHKCPLTFDSGLQAERHFINDHAWNKQDGLEIIE